MPSFDSALTPEMVRLNLRQNDSSLSRCIRAIAMATNPTLLSHLNGQLSASASIRFLAPKS